MNIDKQEMLKKMSALAYQKNDQTLWDAIKEVFELSDKEYLEIQKKAPRWAKSQIMSKKKANEDKSEYELVSASEVCDDFEAAVHKGLNLLAEKNGFKIQQQDIFLKNEAPKSNYQITVKFAKDNTLIITQDDLGPMGRYGEDMIKLSFDWPQASEFTKQMIKSIQNTGFFYTLLPTVLNELMCYKTRTYFAKRLYRSLFTMLKMYDLDYVELKDDVITLNQSTAGIIQTKYHDWLKKKQNNKDHDSFNMNHDLLSHLTYFVENIDKDIESRINFIDHLVINTDSEPSVVCSQQLNLTINLLQSDLFSFSTFETLLKSKKLDIKSSWDALIVDSLNMLVRIDPLINDLIITLFAKKPKEGRAIIDKLWSYDQECNVFPKYQDDFPLYDSCLKKYYVNDGTNTIHD